MTHQRHSPPKSPPPAKLRDGIDRFVQERLVDPGWAVMYVMDSPPFAYTVGLTASYGHPEVVLYGLPQGDAMGLLNNLARRVKAGERFGHGQRVSRLMAEHDALLAHVPAEYREGVCSIASDLYAGTAFEVLQLIWPDPAGKFPGDPGYEEKWRELQPVLAPNRLNLQ